MARIEELPDDFVESLNLNQHQASASCVSPQVSYITPFPIKEDGSKEGPSTTPAMPPGMASVKSHTADEILEMMNRTPLFMTDLAKATEDGENPDLEAIRALQYEGTRAEVAQEFRENGNDLTRAKKWKDGKEFYTKGIAVLTGQHKRERGTDSGEDHQKEQDILEACYINRALCNLELRNYRSTTLDCASALRLNPKNIKAYYRSSSALLALDKIPEAEDSCARGLQLDPSNKALQTLSAQILSRKSSLDGIAAKKRAEQERLQKEKFVLNAALRARDIKLRTTDQPPELEDAVIQLLPDPLSPESHLVFPCVFLYPMDAQSDFIKAFAETETIMDHLNYIFPLPWDSRQDYTINSVDCYVETTRGGLTKVGKKMTLLGVLTGGKVEVVDGLVKVNIVPASKAPKWIEEMKARKSA